MCDPTQPRPPADPEGNPTAEDQLDTSRLEGATVLVADDVEFNREMLRAQLSRLPLTLVEAPDGATVLETAGKIHLDLILLDVMMPGLDGYETCRRLKENPRTRSIPVMFLTAKTETADIVQGFRAGAVDYVSKPFHTEELLARVQTHVELRRAREEISDLRQLIPICAWCRKIRRPDGDWQTLEGYLAEQTGSMVTHGICPSCKSKL